MALKHKMTRLRNDICKWQHLASHIFDNESRAIERIMEAQRLLTRILKYLPTP